MVVFANCKYRLESKGMRIPYNDDSYPNYAKGHYLPGDEPREYCSKTDEDCFENDDISVTDCFRFKKAECICSDCFNSEYSENCLYYDSENPNILYCSNNEMHIEISNNKYDLIVLKSIEEVLSLNLAELEDIEFSDLKLTNESLNELIKIMEMYAGTLVPNKKFKKFTKTEIKEWIYLKDISKTISSRFKEE